MEFRKHPDLPSFDSSKYILRFVYTVVLTILFSIALFRRIGHMYSLFILLQPFSMYVKRKLSSSSLSIDSYNTCLKIKQHSSPPFWSKCLQTFLLESVLIFYVENTYLPNCMIHLKCLSFQCISEQMLNIAIYYELLSSVSNISYFISYLLYSYF